MFGLNEITYWQFFKGILLCLLVYYFILFVYLLIKSKDKVVKRDFEQEVIYPNQEIKTKQISVGAYPVKTSVSRKFEKEEFFVRPDNQMDISGLPLDTFSRPCKMELSRFEEELAYAINQSVLS